MLGDLDHLDDACDLFTRHTLHRDGRSRGQILGMSSGHFSRVNGSVLLNGRIRMGLEAFLQISVLYILLGPNVFIRSSFVFFTIIVSVSSSVIYHSLVRSWCQ